MDMDIRVNSDHQGMRLDVWASEISGKSRHAVQVAIQEGYITLHGRKVKVSRRLKGGDLVHLDFPAPLPMAAVPEPIPIDVVYEDEAILVVNKARGMVVHPAVGHHSGTLVNAVLYRVGELPGDEPFRPGVVHRLDRDTSGLLVVAKTEQARESLTTQLKDRTVHRRYVALVEGGVPGPRTLDLPIGRDPLHRQRFAVLVEGKRAVTHFRVLERYADKSLLSLRLETGRTHQIRVHLAYIGHPVVDDPVYGKKGGAGQLLHAERLSFIHPKTGEQVAFTAPWPEDLASAVKRLREMGPVEIVSDEEDT